MAPRRPLGQEQLALVTLMARMSVFVQQHDLRYAGEGVKLGDGSKPVAWWLPVGAKNYRVLLGDLTFADWPKEKLPAVPPSSQPAARSGAFQPE